MKQYDLIVIGGGSGLAVSSYAANQLEWHVAVVEKGPLGGTCLNRGCIPSKIIIHTADVAETIRRAGEFGLDASLNSVDFAAVTNRASHFVDEDAEQIKQAIGVHPRMDLYQMEAHFTDNKTLQVGDEKIAADRIVIAAGTRPFVPPIEGLDVVDYITSKEALRLTEQPKCMVIVGGGYISAELGHFYGALGTEVTIVERGDHLLGREDSDIATAFTRLFSKKHNVLLGATVQRVAQKGGTKQVTVVHDDGSEETLECDALLIATGRRSNVDLLKLEQTDIALTDKGLVETNDSMETNIKGVWALGDIVGKAPFKHGANEEAAVVVANIAGEHRATMDYSIMPHAVFSSPQVAGVGLTEDEAKEQGLHYEVRRHEYSKTGMGKALEENDGFVKFIVDPHEQTILGCHILGPDASTLIHEVIVAMTAADGKIAAIFDTIHIHPALSEVVQRAL